MYVQFNNTIAHANTSVPVNSETTFAFNMTLISV